MKPEAILFGAYLGAVATIGVMLLMRRIEADAERSAQRALFRWGDQLNERVGHRLTAIEDVLEKWAASPVWPPATPEPVAEAAS